MMRERARAVLESVTSFWSGLRDTEFGGFYGQVDFDLTIHKDADKGCILNSRILWFFSNAYLLLRDQTLLAHASSAYALLKDSFIDKEHGGLFWYVTHDGKPSDTTKHAYNQAFGMYALSSYLRASGDEEAIGLIKELYRLIEDRCADWGENGLIGYKEAFSRDFSPAGNGKLSENGIMAEKTMNTLLHLAEGYAGCLQARPDPEIEKSLEKMLELYMDKVYSEENRRSEVFFDSSMNSLIDLQSYGHDIEASWLLDWCASFVDNEDLKEKVGRASLVLVESVYERAFKEGSLINERENGVNDLSRIWWVQAESVVGFIHAFKRTGNSKYMAAAESVMTYIEEKITDKRPGSEWFWSVGADGIPSRNPIANEWKCPYHNGRMCLEALRRLADD
ncbi:MAG: AGE family epimerase/isomerase [Clostridiales bacterium]|jgi:mannobiose 2-epimerase|nr:AGE family epimerase/isomerase [Clostridiales bacterium]